MKPPARERAEREDDAGEAADSDEQVDHDHAADEGAFMFGEGGEDEMDEMDGHNLMHEGGEDQMDEDPEDQELEPKDGDDQQMADHVDEGKAEAENEEA